MQTRATRLVENTREEGTLYVAVELGHRRWCTPFGDGTRVRDVQCPPAISSNSRRSWRQPVPGFGSGAPAG
jgi:hypothetical protein